MTAAFEELSAVLLNSGFFKGLIDTGTGFLNVLTDIIENIGTIPTLLTAITASMSLLNKDAGKVNMPPYARLQFRGIG
jgi:hypothetical protein